MKSGQESNRRRKMSINIKNAVIVALFAITASAQAATKPHYKSIVVDLPLKSP